MQIVDQQYELVALDALALHPRNVNQGDIGAIHGSIQHNGFYGAVVAQRSTGHILAGNHRYQAARQSKAEAIPCIWVDVDDEAALRILLADNRTTRLGHDDPAALAELLKEIQAETGTLNGTGYDGDALDQLLKDLESGAVPEGEYPELPDGDKQPFCQKTFTLHDEQASDVDRAIEKAKAMGAFVDSPNENANGNALARICETFLRMRND